ncbi:unnamed protein product [Anisakis simplex]|uniref:MFS domain-containing protein n=1 Tax=Anisakis simplex TaxID=6269 RepID=A0A0M3J772_ANISI|nr:unnamed protein product [Anisakis simplex]
MSVAPRGNHAKLIALFAVLACLSNFQDSYPNSYPNTAYGSFQTFINDSYIDRGSPGGLSETQFSWLWSAMLNIWAIGYLTGTFVAPFFTERFGRKFTLIGANTGSIVGTSLAIVAVSCEVPELLFTARLCSSLMSGISCSALFLFLQVILWIIPF